MSDSERQPWEIYQDDIHALLDALGLGTHARPESPHDVLHKEIIPEIRKHRRKLREIEDLTDTGGGPDDPVLTPEGANILIRIGQIAHRTLNNEN